jgi:hypothetical protein
MEFFQRVILIGAMLALGIFLIFAAKLLLGLMAKVWVVLILAAAGFFLVVAVIRINSRPAGVPSRVNIAATY